MFSRRPYDGRLPGESVQMGTPRKRTATHPSIWELGALRKLLTNPPEPPPLPVQLKV